MLPRGRDRGPYRVLQTSSPLVRKDPPTGCPCQRAAQSTGFRVRTSTLSHYLVGCSSAGEETLARRSPLPIDAGGETPRECVAPLKSPLRNNPARSRPCLPHGRTDRFVSDGVPTPPSG